MTHTDPSSNASLVDYSFWGDLVERTTRQLLQTAAPILATVAATGSGLDLDEAALALVTVVIFTVLKNIATISLSETASSGTAALVDRAGSAAAATLVAFLPQAALASWSDWGNVNWGAALAATAASALLAVLNYFLAPPVLSKGDVALAA